MVSESINSGKKVVVFQLDKNKSGVSKQEEAMAGLEHDGYISIAKAKELSLVMNRVLNEKAPVRQLDDAEKIYEAMRALI